jgi:hypothetical protein
VFGSFVVVLLLVACQPSAPPPVTVTPTTTPEPSTKTLGTAIVEDCTTYRENMLCELLAAWNTRSEPQEMSAQVVKIISGKVPVELVDPIAQCLMLSRANDRGAAIASLRNCLAAVKPDLAAAGSLGAGQMSLDGALGLAGMLRPTGPKQGGARNCGTSGGINPALAQTSKPWNFGNWPNTSKAPPDSAEHYNASKEWTEYQRLEKEATQKWQQFVEVSFREIELPGDASAEQQEAAKQATQDARNEANKAIEARDQFKPKVSDGNDGVVPDDGGTAVARTVPGFEDPCTVVNQFLGECAATNWVTSPCQVFLSQLNSCDTTIMLIDPEGTSCASLPKSVDAKTFEQIMTAVCWSRVRPAGPDEDPCAPRSLDGAVVIVMQPNPCADPRAQPHPDDGTCNGSIVDPTKSTDILLGRSSMGDVIAALEKLCGCDLPIDVPGDRPGDPRAYEPVAWSANSAWSPIH